MSKKKQFVFNEEARKKILDGVNVLNDCVSASLGPAGRLILHTRLNQNPVATKDGVSVAKQVHLKDPFENLGAQICRESAEKTNQFCGDGSSTSIILGKELIVEGFKLVAAGHKPIDLKRGIDWAVEKVVEDLKETSKPISSAKEIAQVGTISANGDREIGDLIAEGMEKVGNNGVITIEENNGIATELKITSGFFCDRGYLAPHFVNTERGDCELKEPLILITDQCINNSAVMLPAMEAIYKQYPGRSILVCADNVEGEALALLALNSLKGSLSAAAIRLPGFGLRKEEMMYDLAALTNATVCSADLGYKLEKFDTAWLGSCKKTVITKNSTTIIEGAGSAEDVEKRVEQIRAGMEQCDSEWDLERQQERLAKMIGGVAQIRVGAASEAELKEKKDRCEDALNACRASSEEGIHPGGGVSLLRISKKLEDLTPPENLRYGKDIISKALASPIKQILINAGLEPAEIILNILANENPNFGYNAETNTYEDLLKSGVIDPTKIIRHSLQNAASVAGVLLLTEVLIVDEEEPSTK
jgi:chaperonin GroEL